MPPFYEGIAEFNNLIFTNNPNQLRWSPSKQGLTLTHISGLSTCILGHRMLLPTSLQPICNETLIVNQTFSCVAAPQSTYLACSQGLITFISTSRFLESKDYYDLVRLLPCLPVHDPEALLPNWEEKSHHKREPVSAITLAVVLGLEAAGPGTGIASLITSNQQYTHLTQLSQTVN